MSNFAGRIRRPLNERDSGWSGIRYCSKKHVRSSEDKLEVFIKESNQDHLKRRGRRLVEANNEEKAFDFANVYLYKI
jgi:hypothetical protein